MSNRLTPNAAKFRRAPTKKVCQVSAFRNFCSP